MTHLAFFLYWKFENFEISAYIWLLLLISTFLILILIWFRKFIWKKINLICTLAEARRDPLEPRIGGVEQTQTSNKPKLRKNPNFEQI